MVAKFRFVPASGHIGVDKGQLAGLLLHFVFAPFLQHLNQIAQYVEAKTVGIAVVMIVGKLIFPVDMNSECAACSHDILPI